MKKYYKILLVAVFAAFPFVQSCECPCDESFNELVCSPRETTITEFDGGIIDSVEYIINEGDTLGTYYYPVDEYSIHTFEFPFNRSQSGSLPNDEDSFIARKGVDSAVVVSVPMENYNIDLPYFYALTDAFPANKIMIGDILVEDIDLSTDPNDPTASIRVGGSIMRVSPNYGPPYMSESSRRFCEYINDEFTVDGDLNESLVEELRENLSEYGRGISGSTTNEYTAANGYSPVVVNKFGQILVDRNGNINQNIYPRPEGLEASIAVVRNSFPDAAGDLYRIAEEKEYEAVTIEVHIGDVFFYRARNGRDFVFAVINIDERDVGAALKRRISIMFNEM
jgi:hypothetical protein